MTKTDFTSADRKAQAKHEKYLARALKIHGDKFDYSLAFFSSSTTRVKIKCKTCATVFTPSVNNHLNTKTGCPSCNKGAAAPLTKVEYIKKARKKHGQKYDYSAVQYRGLRAKINIICPKHGPFTQTAAQHLRYGCTDCGKEISGGWRRRDYIKRAQRINAGRARLYLIRCFGNDEHFYKIGITAKGSTAARFHKKAKLGYSYEVIREIEGDAGFIYDAEKQFHKMNKKHKYEPAIKFGGHTECFSEITDDARFLLDVI